MSFFRMALIRVEALRSVLLPSTGGDPGGWVRWILIVAACFLGTWICLRMAPLCGGSGIPQVKAEIRGQMFQDWKKTLVAKIAGGILSIGAGLSLGREGPSIQIGAMVGKGFATLTDRLATEEKLLITAGAGAGLSCAFSAPLAGIVFSLEELHKNFNDEILLSTMVASIASDFVAYYLFGLDPVFDLRVDGGLPLTMYWLILPLGILLGAFGRFYNYFTGLVQDLYDHIPWRAGRLAIPFALILPLTFLYPMALGSGHTLVGAVADGEFLLKGLAFLLLIKFLYSMISFGSGAPGGIFLPLLVMGAISGGLYATAMGQLFGMENIYLQNFIIYGMVGLFTAIVRAPITGVILITEMAGDFSNFLSLCIVAFAADVTADLLGGIPIYEQLMYRTLGNGKTFGMTRSLRKNKVLLEWDVCVGSRMDGGFLREICLPRGCLVVAVNRGEEEIVPGGDTMLHGGDRLTVLCYQGEMDIAQRILENTCSKVGR